MKFKRKNNIIEAEQWFPGKKMSIAEVITSPVLEPTEDNPSGEYGKIRQEDGIYCLLYPGEWVTKDAKGRVFVEYDSIIKEEYAEVKEPPVFVPYSYVPELLDNPPPTTYTFTPDTSSLVETDPEIKKQLARIEQKLNMLMKHIGIKE